MKDKVCALIPSSGDEVAAIVRGLDEIARLAAADMSVNDCILFVPGKSNLDGTSLSDALGKAATKALASGLVFSYKGIEFHLETNRTMKRYSQGSAALVVYADQKMMDTIDSNPNLRFVVAVPHDCDAIDQWNLSWSPYIPGKQREEKKIIEDAVVEAALASLTERVNLANKILNPRDTEATKDAFRILRAHGHVEDGAKIRAWCIKNGWDPKGADEVRKYAEKAFSMKSSPVKRGTHWASDIHAKWTAASRIEHKA